MNHIKPPTTTTAPITLNVIANAGLPDTEAGVVGDVDVGVGLVVVVGVEAGDIPQLGYISA